MAASVTVRELAEKDYPAWAKLVAGSPSGSPYSTAEYLDALCSAAGGTFRILAVMRGEEMVAGVGLYERAGRAGKWIWPRLLLYYNGLVLRHFETKYPSQQTSRSVEALNALAGAIAERGYANVILKNRSPLDDLRPFISRGWDVRASYTYVVNLTDLTAQWGRVEQNLRRLVERARQQGLVFTQDDDFDGFYALHAATLYRRDVAAYLPKEPFSRWYTRLRGQNIARLYHARMPDGRIAATQLVLAGAHRVSHTISAAADPELQSSGANPFLRWHAFEALSKEGYTGNDLTDASLNPVTHFKAQLGGDLAVTLVATSPSSRGWRIHSALEQAYRGARGLARGLRDRVRGRRGEEAQ
ncbi:MAG TPA: GNAT family N-acetyltransferase [Gemmatimonadales bacterium]|nr:GNAT family N-acetyltransferase [Gemmatimonadales bacterium]